MHVIVLVSFSVIILNHHFHHCSPYQVKFPLYPFSDFQVYHMNSSSTGIDLLKNTVRLERILGTDKASPWPID